MDMTRLMDFWKLLAVVFDLFHFFNIFFQKCHTWAQESMASKIYHGVAMEFQTLMTCQYILMPAYSEYSLNLDN